MGGGHNKHGAGSRCTLPKQCRPPSPRRRWRCDRSSYKRSLFSRIRDSLVHYLTGPETTEPAPRHRLGFAWGRTTPGWARPPFITSCAPPHLRARRRGHVCHIDRVAGRGVRGREGRGGRRGRGSASAEVSRRAVDIATSRRTTHTKNIAHSHVASSHFRRLHYIHTCSCRW